jgi:hypothetical protein
VLGYSERFLVEVTLLYENKKVSLSCFSHVVSCFDGGCNATNNGVSKLCGWNDLFSVSSEKYYG